MEILFGHLKIPKWYKLLRVEAVEIIFSTPPTHIAIFYSRPPVAGGGDETAAAAEWMNLWCVCPPKNIRLAHVQVHFAWYLFLGRERERGVSLMFALIKSGIMFNACRGRTVLRVFSDHTATIASSGRVFAGIFIFNTIKWQCPPTSDSTVGVGSTLKRLINNRERPHPLKV